MSPTMRYILALPFLALAILFSIPSYLCMQAAGLIEREF